MHSKTFSIYLLAIAGIWGVYSAKALAASDAEWFTSINASFGLATVDNITHRGSIGAGLPIGNDIDGAIKDRETNDFTAGVGLAFGRRMGYWNVSAEYIWRYRTDWDVVVATPSIQTITNVFSNVKSSTLMLNAARRGPISQFWSWELGAGIGLVRNSLESEYIERAVPGVTPEQKFRDNSSDTEFSYNVFAGITRDLGGPWTLNIRYRYIDLGELTAGPFPDRNAKVYGDHSSQELQFSLEWDL